MGNLPANVHVAGDDSHSRLMSAYERIDRVRPGAVKDWAMDHCRLIEPRDISRAAKLGLMWSCAPPGARADGVRAGCVRRRVENLFEVVERSAFTVVQRNDRNTPRAFHERNVAKLARHHNLFNNRLAVGRSLGKRRWRKRRKDTQEKRGSEKTGLSTHRSQS